VATGIITLGAFSALLGTAVGTVVNFGDGATVDGAGPPAPAAASLARVATCTLLPATSASQTFTTGSYCWAGGVAITAGSKIVLSGGGDFAFTAAGAIVTGASVVVTASNAASVSWVAGGAVTLGALTQLPGSVTAAAAITLGTYLAPLPSPPADRSLTPPFSRALRRRRCERRRVAVGRRCRDAGRAGGGAGRRDG
jgi:hypothetical protein